MVEVFITDTSESIDKAVKKMFSHLKESKIPILKRSNKIYIKVNGIDFKKHT